MPNNSCKFAVCLVGLAASWLGNAVRVDENTSANELEKDLQVAANVTFDNLHSCVSTSPWKGLREASGESDLTSEFVAQVNERSYNPIHIRQRNLMFCGPAAFLYVMAYSDPLKYEDFCKQLFCTGEYRKNGKKLVDAKAWTIAQYLGGGSVLNVNITHHSPIPVADWIAESSLVHHKNSWNSPTPEATFAQLTMPENMEKWVSTFLDAKYKVYGSYIRFAMGKISPMKSHVPRPDWEKVISGVSFGQGQVLAILLTEWSVPGIPSHWVPLVRVDKPDNRCWVKTWGRYGYANCDYLKYMTFMAILVNFTAGQGGGVSNEQVLKMKKLVDFDTSKKSEKMFDYGGEHTLAKIGLASFEP